MSKDIMGRVDVICATCIGACDEILEEFKFPVVLIDGKERERVYRLTCIL